MNSDIFAVGPDIHTVHKPVPLRNSFVVNVQAADLERKYSPNVKLTANPRSINILAYLSKHNLATYYNKADPTNDYFHLRLESLRAQHISSLTSNTLLSDTDVLAFYHAPFNNKGFKFKMSKKKLNNCASLIGRLVKLKLRVRPYDYHNDADNNRRAGLSIIVSEVTTVN